MFLGDIGVDSMSGTIPESLIAAFQMTFAIITPSLVIGAYVERMKFAAALLFSTLWLLFVYARSPTGSGAAASWSAGALWISPAASWSTPRPVRRPLTAR